jgi:hypothetical protein
MKNKIAVKFVPLIRNEKDAPQTYFSLKLIMDKLNLRLLILAWIFISTFSCTPKKEPPFIDNGESCKLPVHECLDSLLNIRDTVQAGNLKLRIYFDTVEYNVKGSGQKTGEDSLVHYNKIVKPINKIIEITLDKESELLEFGEVYGLKIFHAQAVEYGKLKHILRYDFFIHEDGCWRRYKLHFGYLYLKDYENEPDFGFSIGGEEEEGYIQLKARMERASK